MSCTLHTLDALQQRYTQMAQAAARQDWAALTATEREAAALQAQLEAEGFEVDADEREQAALMIERILELDRQVRERAQPYLDEAGKALNDSREALVETTRSTAVHRAYGKLTPR